ncbi:hypothetical protein HY57_19990 [Dyella japonica A8]|uniref:YfhO family protein n=2 Tax=Dyella japonica TaxID=231455 RepID=A0A075K5H9_9GAMM|nr:hypothetical protein HY57_19990 [Dyella japonica A8]
MGWSFAYGLRRFLVLLIEAGLATAFVFAVCEHYKPHFFFVDESSRQYGPIFQYIGHQLLNGKWPSLTIDMWQGGFLFGENQYGLLNPVTMLGAVLSALCPTARIGLFAIDAYYTVLLWFGGWLLAGNFELPRAYRRIFAFLLISNNFVVYWFTSNWTAGLIGQTWVVWVAFCLTLQVVRAPALILGAFSAFAAINSGWPHAIVATFILAGGVGAVALWTRDWRRVAYVGLIMLSALIASLPSILVTRDLLSISSRGSGFYNNWLLVPVLSDILNLGSPTLLPHLKGFHDKNVSLPIFFIAWFGWAPLLLVKPNWRVFLKPRLLGLLVGAAVLLFLSLGPEQIGPLRWPFRFVPYFQFLALLFILVLYRESREREIGVGVAVTLALLFVVPQVMSIQFQPENMKNAVSGTLLLLVAGLSVAYVSKINARLVAHFVLLWSGIFFVFTHAIYPANDIVTDAPDLWHDPAVDRRETIDDIEVSGKFSDPIEYVFASANSTAGDHLINGYLRLSSGQRFVNGYSPANHARLQELFCLDFAGAVCDRSPMALFEAEPQSGRKFVDLMRIRAIVVPSREAGHAPEGWQAETMGDQFARWVRKDPTTFPPGTISFTGSAITGVMEPANVGVEATKEIVNISVSQDRAPAGPLARSLIFARLWWPGYVARIDGKKVSVSPHDGLLVRVDVPDGISGSARLVLTFEPLKGRRWALLPLGMIVLLTGSLLFRRIGRRPSDERSAGQSGAV